MDVKSGADLLKNTTRGHTGILTVYNGEIVPFTHKPMGPLHEELGIYNHARLLGVEHVLNADLRGVNCNSLLGALKKGWGIHHTKPYTIHNHERIQSVLWEDIQSNPQFQRSVGTVFVKYMGRLPTNEEYTRFIMRINQLLPEGVYDISKPRDKRLLLTVSFSKSRNTT